MKANLAPGGKKNNSSKMVLVVEQMQCLTIWTIKTCILIMYNRLTMSLRQNLAVKIVGGYVLLSQLTPLFVLAVSGTYVGPNESQASSSWKSYTSESGAAPLASTGQCLPTVVCLYHRPLRARDVSPFVLTSRHPL